MRLLLDTHIFLWLISEQQRLSEATLNAISDRDNEVYLSVVSLWEVIIKHGRGRLRLPQPPDRYLPAQRERHQIASLPIDEACVLRLARLPNVHRDPFDRMLVCQAIENGLTIVTVDDEIRAYPVAVLDFV